MPTVVLCWTPQRRVPIEQYRADSAGPQTGYRISSSGDSGPDFSLSPVPTGDRTEGKGKGYLYAIVGILEEGAD